jgi:Phage tail tube protein, GTA-gp10
MNNPLTTKVTAFFGDGKHDFKLTVPMINELERTTGTGIGGLCKRLFNSDFKLHEITEVIRLGLIGAGENPETANALVKNYLTDQPLGSAYPLAVSILEALMFGVDPLTTKDAE